MNTWPDPARPGVPPQDGVYWLQHKAVGDKQPCLYEKGRWYCCGSDIGLSPMRCAARYSYLGPVLTPDEVAKREDAKWHEGYAVGVLDVRRAGIERRTKHKALQKRVAELEAQNDMLRHATDKLRAMLAKLNARHEPLQRAFITAVELLNDAALEGGKNE